MEKLNFKHELLLIFFFFVSTMSAQVGIGTINPKGQLDIESTNLGLVVPRVTSIEDVTDGNGNSAVDGTIVYDKSRNKICFRIEGSWICIGKNAYGKADMSSDSYLKGLYNYIKASNTEPNDRFGFSVSLSTDGMHLAVGAYLEDSNATGINGNESSNNKPNSGAVYIYVKNGDTWSQEAYIKASNTDSLDAFGSSVSISSDGTHLAVGAYNEDSNATGINGNQNDNSKPNSGAVYIFVNNGGTWSQEAYIKASNPDNYDTFGRSVSLSSDGTHLAVGAISEDSNATGINGNQSDNTADYSGAVYVFSRSGSNWSQDAYIKASNTDANDNFGNSVSLSSDGKYLAVGANYEQSNTTGINGNQNDNNANFSGAVYVFSRNGSTWSQDAYIKASNTESSDKFGYSVSLSSDGTYLAVGAKDEDSNATGTNGNQNDNTKDNSGAVYVFNRSGSAWIQETYIKASNTDSGDRFGSCVSLSSDGLHLSVSAIYEDSNATEINNDQNNYSPYAGAVYVFSRNGSVWNQDAYVKASNTDSKDQFGSSVSISSDGKYIAVGAHYEQSYATGINGIQDDNSMDKSGAVYIIE